MRMKGKKLCEQNTSKLQQQVTDNNNNKKSNKDGTQQRAAGRQNQSKKSAKTADRDREGEREHKVQNFEQKVVDLFMPYHDGSEIFMEMTCNGHRVTVVVKFDDFLFGFQKSFFRFFVFLFSCFNNLFHYFDHISSSVCWFVCSGLTGLHWNSLDLA